MDFESYCRHIGFEGVSLEGPTTGPNAALNWKCSSGSTRASIDVHALCRWEYSRSDVYGRVLDVNNAYSWRCYRAAPPPSTVTQLKAVTYRAFDDHTETLVPWQGEKVTVLSQAGVTRDGGAMTRLVSALDRAYRFYADMTGREPDPYFTLNGRDTIAQVSATCGAGCGYLGATGVEIANSFFESMYAAVLQHDYYDQIPFYELGRNFYYFGEQLGFHEPDADPVGTGFAVWMRFESMDAAVVEGDSSFQQLKETAKSLVDYYESHPSITFADTLAQNRSPAALNGTDFWASLMMRLADRYGGDRFIKRFWHKVATLGPATSTAGAVANWQQAASFAACADLSSVFYIRWGFPRPDGVVASRPTAESVPYPPQGGCRSLPTPQPPIEQPPTQQPGQVYCVVPTVIGRTYAGAKKRLRSHHCRVGQITKRRTSRAKRGHVIKQRPRPGTWWNAGKKVALTIGR